MKSSEKIALALDIIPYLVDHNGITREEAAHHFGITPRELTSILETAVCCGVPGYYGGDLIDIDIWGNNIYVYTAQGLEKPLRFTPAERAALTLALRQVEKVPGLLNNSAVESVLAKLGENYDTAAPADISGSPSTLPGLADAITTAIAKQRILIIDYVNGTGERTMNRQIVPYKINIQHGYAYLIAWSTEASELRQFRLDRILDFSEGSPWTGKSPVTSTDIQLFIENKAAPHKAYILLRTDAVWLVELLGISITGSTSEGLCGTLPYFSDTWLLQTAQQYADYLVVRKPEQIEKIVVDRASKALAR